MSNQTSLRVADLPQNAPTSFDLRPDTKALEAPAETPAPKTPLSEAPEADAKKA